MSQASEIEWRDMTQAVPAFLTLILIPLTFSITNGILFGLGSSLALYISTGGMHQDLVKMYTDSTWKFDCGKEPDSDEELPYVAGARVETLSPRQKKMFAKTSSPSPASPLYRSLS